MNSPHLQTVHLVLQEKTVGRGLYRVRADSPQHTVDAQRMALVWTTLLSGSHRASPTESLVILIDSFDWTFCQKLSQVGFKGVKICPHPSPRPINEDLTNSKARGQGRWLNLAHYENLGCLPGCTKQTTF